jgi:hypothetical protein
MFIIILVHRKILVSGIKSQGPLFQYQIISLKDLSETATKNLSDFLDIARSSCSEVKSMIYLANRLKFIDDTIRENLIAKAEEVFKIIYGLIKSLQK